MDLAGFAGRLVAYYTPSSFTRQDARATSISFQSQATLATFLAAVQAQTTTFSFQSNSTNLETAINVLAFMGLMFDVSSAFLAFLTSTLIQTILLRIEAQLDGIKQSPHDLLQHTFDNETITALFKGSPFGRSIAMEITDIIAKKTKEAEEQKDLLRENGATPSMPSLFARDRLNALEMIKSTRGIDIYRTIGHASGTALLFGIISFLASIICLTVATQPRVVWVCTVIACSCTAIFPFVNSMLTPLNMKLPNVFLD